MAWENPVTTWGQAGKTVPGAGDFNRIEGNIQHLQDTKETPAGAQAKAEAAAGAVQAELNTHKADNTAHVPHLGTTTNSDNNYSITSTKVINDGAKFSVKFNVAATGAATLKISSDGTARALKKPGDGDFKPKAGIYTLIRDGSNFQLLGEGGEYGTATASDVLSGKTIGTEDGLVEGTMVDRGTVTNTITTQGGSYTIPSGYHNGSGKVTASFSNLSAGNIKKGVNIGGVVGTVDALFPLIDSSVSLSFGVIDSNKYLRKIREISLKVGTTTSVTLNAILFSVVDSANLSVSSSNYFWVRNQAVKSWTPPQEGSNEQIPIYNPNRANITITASGSSSYRYDCAVFIE